MLAALLLCCATQAEPLPDANDYVRGLVERHRRNEAILDDYTYDLTELREALDRHGRTTRRRIRRYEVFHVRGRAVRRLVEEDTWPLSPRRQREEDARVREKVRAITEGQLGTERPGLRLSTILERYDFEELGREELRGRSARFFEFRAFEAEGEGREDGDRELEDDEDVLRTLTGMIWVDEADQQVVRAQVYSEVGTRFRLGPLGTLSELGFELSFRKTDEQIWLPSSLRTIVGGRKRIRTFLRRRTLMFEHYRRFEVESVESLHF